ncbi:MAG TPA: CBS domain-containing protein, partial [Nitrososphaerales archaeon]|nr:CBS domain-containing protein [Nitrososphaerales archaeon]
MSYSHAIDSLRVSDFVEPVSMFSPSDTVSHLIGTLKNSKGYEGFVEENSRTCTITLREILGVENADTTKVSALMLPVPRLNAGDSIVFAAKLMFENKLRALPVYENGKLQGKVTSPSIVKRLIEANPPKETLPKIMTADPICLVDSDSTSKARSMMMRRKIDQLPILKAGELAGVITSVDIVFSFLSAPLDRDSKGGREDSRFSAPVSSLASVETTSNDVKDSLSRVAQEMLRMSTNYSVITSNGSVKGIVTFRDFLKLLPIAGVNEDVPVSIIGLPDNPLEAELVTSKFTASVRLLQKMDPTVSGVR